MFDTENYRSENSILVSVVVPIYGVAKYLKQCLDSIINQTYKNLEIILVDDGSIDDSANICDEYSAKESRIIVIHKENGGLVSARKAGVQNCTGEYTAYVDGDDWIDLDYFEKLINFKDFLKTDMIVCNHVREGKKQIVENLYLEEGYYNRKDLEEIVFPKMLYAGEFYKFGFAQYQHKIFRTDLLKKYQMMVPDDISMGEDVALTYPMLLECNGVYVSNAPLYHYRFNEEGLSIRFRENTTIETKNLLEYLRLKLPQEYELHQQLDYYNCLMALTNVVNTARGGLIKGFEARINNLLTYLNETGVQSSLKRCHLKGQVMGTSTRIGVIMLKLKLYRTAVILYSIKNTIMAKMP